MPGALRHPARHTNTYMHVRSCITCTDTHFNTYTYRCTDTRSFRAFCATHEHIHARTHMYWLHRYMHVYIHTKIYQYRVLQSILHARRISRTHDSTCTYAHVSHAWIHAHVDVYIPDALEQTADRAIIRTHYYAHTHVSHNMIHAHINVYRVLERILRGRGIFLQVLENIVDNRILKNLLDLRVSHCVSHIYIYTNIYIYIYIYMCI